MSAAFKRTDISAGRTDGSERLAGVIKVCAKSYPCRNPVIRTVVQLCDQSVELIGGIDSIYGHDLVREIRSGKSGSSGAGTDQSRAPELINIRSLIGSVYCTIDLCSYYFEQVAVVSSDYSCRIRHGACCSY